MIRKARNKMSQIVLRMALKNMVGLSSVYSHGVVVPYYLGLTLMARLSPIRPRVPTAAPDFLLSSNLLGGRIRHCFTIIHYPSPYCTVPVLTLVWPEQSRAGPGQSGTAGLWQHLLAEKGNITLYWGLEIITFVGSSKSKIIFIYL